VPAAYAVVRRGRVRVAVRRDLEPALSAWLLAPHLEPPPGAEPVRGGRGSAWRIDVPGAGRAVVRLYRRGGLAARFSRDRYLGVRPRPLRELRVTAAVRARGVPAVEVLAARVEGWLVYRGALVTREVPAAVTLIEALHAAPDASTRGTLAAAAGQAVATMHAAGVFHADLNLTNLLVHPGGDGGIVLIDFDRARLRRAPLGSWARRRNLRRLARSLAKLDRGRGLVGAAERSAFLAAYAPRGASDGMAACAC
jgi:3-deoxy-D-manno-octulosonic acid kinase